MYLLRALSGVSSPAGNRPQVRVQSPTVKLSTGHFLMGLPGLLADVPTSRREHVLSATSLCRHSCTSDTSASASPTSSVPSPCIPDSSGCARSPVEPTLPSASRLVQALGFPSKDQVPGGACDRIGGEYRESDCPNQVRLTGCIRTPRDREAGGRRRRRARTGSSGLGQCPRLAPHARHPARHPLGNRPAQTQEPHPGSRCGGGRRGGRSERDAVSTR